MRRLYAAAIAGKQRVIRRRRLYAAALSADKIRGPLVEVDGCAAAICAMNIDHARLMALTECRIRYPESAGYCHQQAAVAPVPRRWYRLRGFYPWTSALRVLEGEEP